MPEVTGSSPVSSTITRRAGGACAVDEKRLQTLLNVLTAILLLVLVGSFTTVIRAALSAS